MMDLAVSNLPGVLPDNSIRLHSLPTQKNGARKLFEWNTNEKTNFPCPEDPSLHTFPDVNLDFPVSYQEISNPRDITVQKDSLP